ncbi:MAG: AsmA-like C-terminal region-containing protein, partial [Methylococcales bacterium]
AFDLAMQRLSGQWQGELACSMAKGTFSLPLEQTEQDVIKLEMRYLNLTELMQVDFQQDTIEMTQMPLIKVVSEQLWWKDSNLGRLQIATERRVNGIRFKNIDVISEQHSIELKADWVGSAGSSFTEMSGRVSTEDFGGFLAQFDFDNDFKDSQGDIDFFAKWPGSPYHFAIEAMEAEMDVELQDGRLASVEPGFGRILGLLAMEQWIKRLTLDFGDIYKQGMSFNRITGHFNIRQGKALSNNLLIDAVPAQIFISGTTDLIAKTFDHRMGVMPKSSGAIPIAGTIVGSIAGVIAQVFTDDYKEGYFFGSHYKVKGPWHDFKVIPIHEQDGLLKKTWTGLTDFSWMSSLAK